jgi:hypothetical protein
VRARPLDVLHLLAHLLDQHFHVDRDARGVEILRLRRERIGLAVELLHQEIQAPAGRFAAAHDAAGFLDVTIEAIELLGHVDTLQLQHDFLFDALAIHRREQFRDAFIEPCAYARLDLGQPCAHLDHERGQPRAALFKELAETLAFAQTHRTQIVQRLLEQRTAGA